jgi:hypothetical protein
MRYYTDIVTGLQAGDALWHDWVDLLDRLPSEHRIFGPEWYGAWNGTMGSGDRWTGQLDLITVRDEQHRLQGVLPLAAKRWGPVTARATAGGWQPWRVVLAAQGLEEAVGRAVGRQLAETPWPIRFGPFRRSSSAAAALCDEAHRRGCRVHRRGSLPLAIAEVPPTWNEYRDRVLGKDQCRKAEGYERRAARMGQLHIEHLRQPSPADSARMFADLATIESRSWLPAAGGDLRFVPAPSRRFWHSLTDAALSPRDQIDCWIMHFDGRPISFCFTMTVAPVRYVIANNFDEAYKTHRTGSVLYRHMMEDGITRGVTSFDFGDGSLHYKQIWVAAYLDQLDVALLVPNPVRAVAHRLWSRVTSERAVPASVSAGAEAGRA